VNLYNLCHLCAIFCLIFFAGCAKLENGKGEVKMKVETLAVGSFGANCVVVWEEGVRKAWVVDPGAESGKILSFLKREGLEIGAVVLTHAHFDHIAALNAITDHEKARDVAVELIKLCQKNQEFFGLFLLFKVRRNQLLVW